MTENYNQPTSPYSTEAHIAYEPATYVESDLTDPTYSYHNLDVLDGNKSTSTDTEDGKDIADLLSKDSTTTLSVADTVVQMLEELGIRSAFGVAGGAMASIWGALSNSGMEVLNCRHESGAAFAAVEAYFASGNPVVVFTTAGPGITNALTGLFAARGEGAKVILLSACTSAPQRGRWAIQETSGFTLPSGGIFAPGALFNFATTVECAAQLPQIFRRLALALSQPGGFVAHLSIPTAVQSTPADIQLPRLDLAHSLSTPSQETVAQCAQLLAEGPFAIWLGFGATGAAKEILQLAEKTGAAVMCSPRGKGIFPENHPQFIGVTGLGGHESVSKYMEEQPPLRTLVLGTRLGEPTSFWSAAMVPNRGFIHVDIDPEVPGVAYPDAETVAVQSDITVFVKALLEQMSEHSMVAKVASLPRPEKEAIAPSENNLVRPEVLMAAIQKVIVEGSDAIVLAESGNSFTWSTHLLRFPQAGRYRVSTGVGSMGHVVTGVIGAAQAHKGLAVAITGDGAMLMNNEISTAVKYQIPAIWIVLNDARYNMCYQGMQLLGMKGADALLPKTDFVAIARGMGADGIRIDNESDLEAALEKAIAAQGPFVVDVLIDPDRMAPSKGRNKGLAAQGIKKSQPTNGNGNGNGHQQISFPLV